MEFVRPRLYEGVVEHMYELAAQGDGDRAGVVVAGSGDRAAEHLPGLHRHADHAGADRAWPTGRDRFGTALLRRGKAISGPKNGRVPIRCRMEDAVAYADNWSDRALLEQGRPGRGGPAARPAVAAGSGPRVGHRPAQTAEAPQIRCGAERLAANAMIA